MSKDNRMYFARVTNAEKKLTIKTGRRPIFFLLDTFTARIEIYLPVSKRNITIKTTSGKIEGNEEYTVSTINMESSSGNILVNSIIAMNVNLRTSSGSIRCKKINGNTSLYTGSGSTNIYNINGSVFVKGSSGSIKLGSVTGNIDAKISSGFINCTVTEDAGDISITSSSGNVLLNIPDNYKFKFHSRTSSGSLRTPFPDKLSSPITDRKTVQGVVGDFNQEDLYLKNINIMTTSGSIRVSWIHLMKTPPHGFCQ